MMPRQLLVVVALLATQAGGVVRSSQPRHPPMTVDAVVERPEPIGPQHVVPWRVVRDLTRQDFEILSDAESRPIESFATDAAPVSMVVLVDVSASAEIAIDWLLEPLQKTLIPALKPGDRVSFGRFGGVGLRVDRRFTGVPRDLMKAARDALTPPRRQNAFPPPVQVDSPTASGIVGAGANAGPPGAGDAISPVTPPSPERFGPVKPDPAILVEGMNGAFGLGASPAWDAVDAAVTALESEPGRRAIIMVTDGRSTGNVHSLDETILHAVAADVCVYVVGEAQEQMIRQSETGAARVRPAAFLESMAEMTGGAYAAVFGPEPLRPARSDAGAVKRWVGRVLARLVDDLHSTYTLGFFATAHDGQVHRLEVRVRKPGLTVRARHGYLAR